MEVDKEQSNALEDMLLMVITECSFSVFLKFLTKLKTVIWIPRLSDQATGLLVYLLYIKDICSLLTKSKTEFKFCQENIAAFRISGSTL